MDFSSSPPGGKLGSADKEQLMDQVKQQIALANAQELLQVVILIVNSKSSLLLYVPLYR